MIVIKMFKNLISIYNSKLIRKITTNRLLLVSDKNGYQAKKLSRNDREEIKKMINYFVYNDIPDHNLENQVKHLKLELIKKVIKVIIV
jgi:hypothetical protein